MLQLPGSNFLRTTMPLGPSYSFPITIVIRTWIRWELFIGGNPHIDRALDFQFTTSSDCIIIQSILHWILGCEPNVDQEEWPYIIKWCVDFFLIYRQKGQFWKWKNIKFDHSLVFIFSFQNKHFNNNTLQHHFSTIAPPLSTKAPRLPPPPPNPLDHVSG